MSPSATSCQFVASASQEFIGRSSGLSYGIRRPGQIFSVRVEDLKDDRIVVYDAILEEEKQKASVAAKVAAYDEQFNWLHNQVRVFYGGMSLADRERQLAEWKQLLTIATSCPHHGEHVETRLCTGCPASRQPTEIFACEKHGRAALRTVAISNAPADAKKADPQVKWCLQCPDHPDPESCKKLRRAIFRQEIASAVQR